MGTLSRPAETSGGDMTPQLHQLLGNSVELLVVLHQLCQPLLLLCVVSCELPGLGEMDLEFGGRSVSGARKLSLPLAARRAARFRC